MVLLKCLQFHMTCYFIPIDERLRIDIFLFSNDRRNLDFLVVFHERFNILAL